MVVIELRISPKSSPNLSPQSRVQSPCFAPTRTRLSPSARKFKREKLKEEESLEDLDHVLDMDDVFWTWFSISGRCRPRTATVNADYDSAVFDDGLYGAMNDRRSECINPEEDGRN